MVAHRGTIVDVNPAGFVDVYPQQLALPGPLEIDELVTQAPQRRFQRLLQIHHQIVRHKQKMGEPPIVFTEP
jgi:hypothetical protein